MNEYNWHLWFAWRPVKIKGRWVWLELVQRRRSSLLDRWVYRRDDNDLYLGFA